MDIDVDTSVDVEKHVDRWLNEGIDPKPQIEPLDDPKHFP